MTIQFKRKISEDELTECLIRIYMRQCLSGANAEYTAGAASTIGIIIGYLGLDPDSIPNEAKRRKKEALLGDALERDTNER